MNAAHNMLSYAYQSYRLNKKVTFPTKLDLTPFMSTTDGTDQYDLYAVVVHLGTTSGGHYICYIKTRRRQWLKLDDREVHVRFCVMTMKIICVPVPVDRFLTSVCRLRLLTRRKYLLLIKVLICFYIAGNCYVCLLEYVYD